jgi:hypothetical protein
MIGSVQRPALNTQFISRHSVWTRFFSFSGEQG